MCGWEAFQLLHCYSHAAGTATECRPTTGCLQELRLSCTTACTEGGRVPAAALDTLRRIMPAACCEIPCSHYLQAS